MDEERSKDGSGVVGMKFSPTRWSLVRRAALGGEELGSWIGLYWFPLYSWARHKGWQAEDAADEVQNFLEKVCRGQLLGQADPSRGRLRSWLLTSFSNHLASSYKRERRIKRGGAVRHVSIQWDEAESAYLRDHSQMSDADALYARAWAMTVLDEALEGLATHYCESGRGVLFEALLPALEAPFEGDTYESVAAGLGMNAAALRQAAVRFRQRYRRILLDVAAKRLGTTCEAQLHSELREFLGG